METFEDYLDRKYSEIRLLNDCLSDSLPLIRPRSVDDVIRTKFRLAAQLRAEHALHDWEATETAWSASTRPTSGPFAFTYDYQRADLSVSGPPFYEESGDWSETIYSGSGMAALSTLLIATARILKKADILLLPGTYSETAELIQRHVPDFRSIAFELTVSHRLTGGQDPQILLLDSCVSATAYECALRCDWSKLDLIVFDTTCFACTSGHIRRVLRRARRYKLPVVLVRSHNKLDSLGVEYGRLGSTTFVNCLDHDNHTPRAPIKRIAAETREAVRLFGGAALPDHFPPYVGSDAYWTLTNRRLAAMLRNGRRAGRLFSRELGPLCAQSHFAHGLYLTLRGRQGLDAEEARKAAECMSRELSDEGHAIRHAGSFGFDFAATEWNRDTTTGEYCIRLAVPDLPSATWQRLAEAVSSWWEKCA
jgi:hypothetical protein